MAAVLVRATRAVSSCLDRSAMSVVLLAAVMALAVAVRPRASSWELMVATRAVTAAMAESICARKRAGRGLLRGRAGGLVGGVQRAGKVGGDGGDGGAQLGQVGP